MGGDRILHMLPTFFSVFCCFYSCGVRRHVCSCYIMFCVFYCSGFCLRCIGAGFCLFIFVYLLLCALFGRIVVFEFKDCLLFFILFFFFF